MPSAKKKCEVSAPRSFHPDDQAAVSRVFRRAWKNKGQESPRFADLACPLGAVIFAGAFAAMHRLAWGHPLLSVLVPPFALGLVNFVFIIRRRRSVDRYIGHAERIGVSDLAKYCSSRPHRQCWISEGVDGEVVGLIVIQCRRDEDRAWLPPHGRVLGIDDRSRGNVPGLASIQWLAVAPRSQRAGVASSLLMVAEEYCRSLKPSLANGFGAISHLRLVSASVERGPLAFYRRHNYTEEHRTNYLSSLSWESSVFLWAPL